MENTNQYAPEVILKEGDKNSPAVNNDFSSTQYANKAIEPKEEKLIIQQIDIRQVIRSEVNIEKWRNAHKIADSRYFPNRTWLYDLYDDILLDGHLSGIITKRIDSVLNKNIYWEADGDYKEECDPFIQSLDFRFVMEHILAAKLWGLTAFEFMPGKEFKPRLIPRKHVKPKWQRIVFEQNGTAGIDYTNAKNIWVLFGNGEPEDLGALLKCAPYVIYKRNALADWAQYVEIFGMPIRLMYYNAHDEQAKIELKEVLDNTGSALGLMIPEGTRFEIPQIPTSNGTGELQKTLLDTLDEQNSIIILGNTETTSARKAGTGAQSKTHQDQQQQILRSDMKYLQAQLNSSQFLAILKTYGFDTTNGRFVFAPDFDTERQKDEIEVAKTLKTVLKVPLDDDELYEKFGYNKPKDYDAQKEKMEQENEDVTGKDNGTGAPGAAPKPQAGKNIKLAARNRSLLRQVIHFFGLARK